MESQIQALARVLLQWGPAGAAIILMIIAENRLRTRWDSTKGQERKICAWLYVGNWIFIALLISVVSTIWVIDRDKTNFSMSGIVQDLTPSHSINDPNGKLFTKINYKSSFLRDVQWHNSDPILPKNLEIRLEKGDDYYDYRIPLAEVDDVLNVHISLKNERLWLKSNEVADKELEVIGSASGELESQTSVNHPHELFLISSVYAGEQVDAEIVLDALESRDSYVRQSASLYLVDNMNTSSSLIEEKILSEKTSITTQIGLISALARASSPELSDQRMWKLSRETEKKVFDFAFSDNKVLATQSRRYLVRNISDPFLDWMDERCANIDDKNLDEKQKCAYIRLNLIYNLAIEKWIQSIGKPIDQSIVELDDALKVLDRGNDLLAQVPEENAIQYGKLIYGKALLNHEMSKLQFAKGSTEGTEASQSNSVSNFKELIAYLDGDHKREYEYPHHLEQANCYIENQTQECFDRFKPYAK